MRIGLCSDTHGWLDPKMIGYFACCDQVWHAGDIGDGIDETQFGQFCNFKAVYGNIDGPRFRHRYPDFLKFQCEELTIWITHIAGHPPRYTPMIREALRHELPDLLVCGHSHILRIMRDTAHPGLLYMNPGAAGMEGLHRVRTVVRFQINGAVVSHVEVIELGLRGNIVNSSSALFDQ